MNISEVKRHMPETILCNQEDLPKHRSPRLLSAMACSLSLETSFSGTTYYLGTTAIAMGCLEGVVSTYSEQKPQRLLQARGAAWKLARFLAGKQSGGFKFSSAYLDSVWPRYLGILEGVTMINNFQLFGGEFFRRRRGMGIGAWFYIDGTLTEYFNTYEKYDEMAIDSKILEQAISMEKEGYKQADGVVVMSQRSAHALANIYGIASEKIHVLIPGCNLLACDSLNSEPPRAHRNRLVLGFVGVYPKRKGLFRLAAAVKILRGRGLPVYLRVIGSCPVEIQTQVGVEYLGYIEKSPDPTQFKDAMNGIDLGCLLSTAELAGIAALEFLHLGIPVIGTDVGGLTDILQGGGSRIMPADVEPEQIAEEIARLWSNPEELNRLKMEATARKTWSTWGRAVSELDALLPQ